MSYRGQRRDIFTGLYCYKSDWAPNMGKVNRTEPLAMTINRNLDAIHHKARECFDEFKFSGDEFTIDQLVDRCWMEWPYRALQMLTILLITLLTVIQYFV